MANMGEEIKYRVKKTLKSIGKIMMFKTLPILLIIIAIIVLLSGLTYEDTIQSGEYREGDMTSTPYAVNKYTTDINIAKDGTINTSMTAQELWDEMIKNNNDIEEYLDGPEELLKLMNAELSTKYPDTRPNPDDDIDWENLNEDVESNYVQGIIKFKRAQSDGKEKTLIYANPDQFYDWVEQYNMTGSEEAKQNALSHFTMEKNVTYNSGVSLDYNGVDIVTDISERIIAATKITPWPGKGLCQSWVRQVYANAGLGSVSYGTAYNAFKNNVVSTDMNNIPIGAAVYATGSGYAGHVGIYIGNGMVMDSVNSGLKVRSLSDWIAEAERLNYPLDGKLGWLGWGWQAGQPTKILSEQDSNKDNSESNDDNKEEEETDKDNANKEQETTTEEEQEQAANEYVSQKISLDNVLFIGDSITDGLKNSGLISGATFYTKIGAAPSYWLERVDSLPQNSDNIKAVCVMLGVNNPSQIEQMKQLIDALVNRYPGKTIYVQKVLPVTVKYTYRNYAEMNNDINSYNEAIKAYCSSKSNVEFIDTSEGYVNSNGTGIVDLFDGEGLHPLNYEQLKSNIEKAINGLGTPANSENQSTFSADYQAVFATWNETEVRISSNDPAVDTTGSITYVMNTQKVDYQTMVSGYIMPFNYLWAFIVAGRDKDFSMELADLVYDSEIVFKVYDNLSITTNVQTDNYTKQVTVQTKDGPRTETRSYYKTTTTIYRVNTINVKLYHANVWIVEYTQDYTYQKPEKTTTDETTGSSTETTKYIESPPNIRPKVEKNNKETNFVNLFLKRSNYELRNNIMSAPDWLFTILERNEDTKDRLLDVTKYLLYLATGSDTGITEFDFGVFDPKNFSSLNSQYGGTSGLEGIPGQIYDFLLAKGVPPVGAAAILGNIEDESGFDPTAVNEIRMYWFMSMVRWQIYKPKELCKFKKF